MSLKGRLKPPVPGWLKAWAILVLLFAIGWGFLLIPTHKGFSEGQQIVLALPGNAEDTPPPNGKPAEIPSIIQTSEIPALKKYAGVSKATKDGYKISVVVLNVGINPDFLKMASEKLPAEVAFAVRADSPNVQEITSQLRETGREVLLMLPMEPNGYPHNDPGPQPLLVDLPVEENLKRIANHTASAEGIIGIVPFMGEAFTQSPKASEPIAKWLSQNGYAVLDNSATRDRNQLGDATLSYGGSFIDNPVILTPALSDSHMKTIKLEYMETVAKRALHSIGVIEGSPLIIPFLNEWFATFSEKKLLLTPVSSAYMSAAERPADPQKRPEATPLREDPIPEFHNETH